jgi:DUF1680 family protein
MTRQPGCGLGLTGAVGLWRFGFCTATARALFFQSLSLVCKLVRAGLKPYARWLGAVRWCEQGRRLGGPLGMFLALGLVLAAAGDEQGVVPERGQLLLHPVPDARFAFAGPVGARIAANLDQWLLCAPRANPGMLEMFRLRDRQPAPQLVPWAGEFAGKYLVSAVLALRQIDHTGLRSHLSNFVAQLLTTQAEDGYLGPFPRSDRLLKHWDLWGHYHLMLGLLTWHQHTGDSAALNTCRRMADLICRTYLDGPRRVYDAGSHEMNMAIIHSLGWLYRLTGEPKYLRLMREIEKDWERAGDYLRTGLAGVEFYATPRPRWESLHDLQGLVELWRITGQAQYRQAFQHHWRSILRWDRHPSGGFSTGEQAVGSPYASGPIETCCTVAWLALSVDMLRLTGEALAADELELATLNAALGAQHPSGRWWTYNTPMNGVREASAHSIVFQARAGTPELNCCAVNGPRALGLLSDWAVMTDGRGLVINWLGPGQFSLRLPDGTPVQLRSDTAYPLSGHIRWTIQLPRGPAQFPIRFRIPGWSAPARVRLNQGEERIGSPGRYLEWLRLWHSGDTVELELELALRIRAGDREASGQVCLYRGPILLAYDQRHNSFDEPDLPALDLSRLAEAKVSFPTNPGPEADLLAPWLLVAMPAQGGRSVRLCDFASAGVAGTRYRSWLPALHLPPPPPIQRLPPDGAVVGPGKTTFRWTTRTNASLSSYRLLIWPLTEDAGPVVQLNNLTQPWVSLDECAKRSLQPGQWYRWQVIAQGPYGQVASVEPALRFRYDPTARSVVEEQTWELGRGAVIVEAPLRGDPKPVWGTLQRATGYTNAPGPDGAPASAVQLDGPEQMLVYALTGELGRDYSVGVWVRLLATPEGRLGQVFSAWAGPMDDPLRITIQDRRLFARLESGQAYSTAGVPVKVGRWYHVAAVKAGTNLTLYVDGQACQSIPVPEWVLTRSEACALGGNPRYPGNEFLAVQLARFTLAARAWSAEEVRERASAFAPEPGTGSSSRSR